MYGRIIDESNPRYRGPFPKPRGLLPVPPEIAEEISRDQAAHQPNYTDERPAAVLGRSFRSESIPEPK
jgi:hypothetical protein